MLYKCDNCNYSTKRLCDLRRHENKKYPCYKKIKVSLCNLEDTQINNLFPQKNNPEPQINNPEPQINNHEPQINNHEPQINNVSALNTNLKCGKCRKVFARKDNLKRHENKCDGYDKRQCRICLRMFTTQQGKWKHTQYVKCSPPPPEFTNQIINNIHNTNNIMNIDQSITNNISNTINLNIRGNFDNITKEDIENIVKQLEKSEYMKMITNNMSKGKYVIPRTIERIYFNDEFPEMQTLKKERRNDKMVEVHVDGKWEKRLVEDIMRKLISKVEDYHTEYFKYLEEKFTNIPIGSKKWNQAVRPIKNFGHMMLWYNGFTGRDIEKIGIELNSPDDEKEKKTKNKDMIKIIKEKVYEFTPKNAVIIQNALME